MTGTLPTEDSKTAIGVDDRGGMAYASAATSGHTEIVLPALPGSPNGETRMLAKDFGPHVAGEIERSITRNPYLKSGPQQSPAQALQHYAASARGAELMDSDTLQRMETLAKELETASDQGEFFSQTVRPFLNGLTPKRR